MGAAVAMTRLDLTAGELRRAARKEKNSTVARRILALALVLEGSDRKKAAESCGMDRQTLRDRCIVITPKAWRDCGRANRWGRDRG